MSASKGDEERGIGRRREEEENENEARSDARRGYLLVEI